MEVRAHHLRVLQEVIERGGDVSHINFSLSEENEHNLPILQEGFKRFYQKIIENPNLEVIIIDTLDKICLACPNSNEVKCLKYLYLYKEDDDAIQGYGLKYGKKYTAGKIVKKLQRGWQAPFN